MFKRAYLSLTRRKSKVIILFIILFVVTTLILTTISINNATSEAEEFARLSIGSEVVLMADMESAREPGKDTNKEDLKEQIQNFERPEIKIEDVNKIGESKYLSGYVYEFTTAANVDENSIEVVESEIDKMGDIKLESDDAINKDEFQGGRGPGGGNQNFEFSFNMKDAMKDFISGDITLAAINNFSYLDEYESGTLTLTDGEPFEEDDENTIIISYDLATLNELEVGDKITLYTTEDETKIEMTIVAIYDTAESSNNEPGRNIMQNSSNTIYTNIITAEKFLTEEEYNEGNYTVDSCTYFLQNPENYDAFLEETNKNIDLEEKNLKLTIDQTSYDKMVGAISEVGSFSKIMFWVVLGASILIITLVINIQVKERNYEIGVLLSLGEKKLNITLQILIEFIIITTFAMILAIIVGMGISDVIADMLLQNQVELSNEQQQVMGGRNFGMNTSNVEQIDELEVSVGLKEMGMLCGVGYLIIIIAMLIPMVKIVKYDPKTILSRRE